MLFLKVIIFKNFLLNQITSSSCDRSRLLTFIFLSFHNFRCFGTILFPSDVFECGHAFTNQVNMEVYKVTQEDQCAKIEEAWYTKENSEFEL